jgi:hypothetical protein
LHVHTGVQPLRVVVTGTVVVVVVVVVCGMGRSWKSIRVSRWSVKPLSWLKYPVRVARAVKLVCAMLPSE